MSFDSPENWIDAELRRVPLPRGLVERLCAASQTTDEDIDEALVDVPVPLELTSQLLAIVDDEAVDARLCDVAIPEELLDNLWAIPYDEALRDVPVPASLLSTLRRVAPSPRRWSAMRMALAASLLLMLTGAYVSSIAGWMLSAYNSSQGLTAIVLALPDRPLELTSSPTIPVTMALADDSQPETSDVAVPIVRGLYEGEIDIRPIDEQLATVMPAGYRLTDNVLPLRFGILGQHDETDERGSGLELLELGEPRGVEPPISAGFDRKFLVKHRTQPIVTLAASPDLARQYLPLWRGTKSFGLLRERTLAGRLPDAHEISVEDFLAAMNCPYAPASPGELAIRTAAGPSVFGDGEASLLQIGVQAGAMRDTSPMHVTLVVDASDSMRWSGRLERVRSGLRQFASHLLPGDRVSLVIYNDGAATLVEDAGRDDLATIYAAIDGLSAYGGSHFGAGLQEGAIAADSPAALAASRRSIVLLTDGLPALSAEVSAKVDQLLQELAKARVAFHVVDVDGSDEVDERLSALATAGGQSLIVASDADTLNRQLLARTRGASPEVASEATIEIAFNPKTVKAYRLLGHEAVSLGGISATVESTLLAGESATVLFEVWLQSEGPSDVADVAVRWIDSDGKEQSARQQVRRVQFVPSFAEAALSLQSAAIAAEAAEALRQSPFSSARSRDLRQVLAVANEVNPRLAARAEYRRFVEVLRQAERTRRQGN